MTEGKELFYFFTCLKISFIILQNKYTGLLN